MLKSNGCNKLGVNLDLKNKNSQINEFELEYYSASVNGWLNTKLEETKTFITLSTGGIGVLLIFFPNIPTNNDWLIYTYFFSICFFVITLIIFTNIFGVNAKYLMEVIVKNKKEEKLNIIKKYIFKLLKINKTSDVLNSLSFLGRIFFFIALILACSLPIYLKINLHDKELELMKLNEKVLDLEKNFDILKKELNSKKG